MRRKLSIAGLLLCTVFPIITVVAIGLVQLMPSCGGGGSSGLASGCYLFGVINMNWFVNLGTLTLVASFITVPIGIIVIFITMIAFELRGGKGD